MKRLTLVVALYSSFVVATQERSLPTSEDALLDRHVAALRERPETPSSESRAIAR